MAVTGRLEITIKINELPAAQDGDNGWKTFQVDCDGYVASVTVKPKVWKKLEDAQANYPQWVGAISGKFGTLTGNTFVLENPAIQVFEKKPKGDTQAEGQTQEQPQAQVKQEKQVQPTPKNVFARPKK